MEAIQLKKPVLTVFYTAFDCHGEKFIGWMQYLDDNAKKDMTVDFIRWLQDDIREQKKPQMLKTVMLTNWIHHEIEETTNE